MKPSKTAGGQHLANACAERAIGAGDPEVYTWEELKTLIEAGLAYNSGLLCGRASARAREQAMAFRRRFEIIQLFKGFPDKFRERPCGESTKTAVIEGLAKRGIRCSERTLTRDYKILGGHDFLRKTAPFRQDEDRSPMDWPAFPNRTRRKS